MSGAALASTFYTVGYAQELARSMDQNQADVLVLSVDEYIGILHDKSKGNSKLRESLSQILDKTAFGQYWRKTLYPNINEAWVTPTAQSALDAFAVTKTFTALGIAGVTSYIKTTPKGTYIILKGFPAHRSPLLAGTRYLASNPAVMRFGLGMKGLRGMAKGGFVLGIVVSSTIEVTDFLFKDEKTMADLVGSIGVEAVKGGLGALAGYAAAAAVGVATTAAVAPLVTMVLVGFVAATFINYLDNKYDVKSRVIEALKMIPEKTANGIYQINQTSASWMSDLRDAIAGKLREKSNQIGREMMDWMCPVCRRY